MTQNKMNSINDLLKDDGGDEDSAQGQLAKRQKEIKEKKIEQLTEEKAQNYGLGYVDLFAFPISPEALVLIDEKEAEENKIISFYYDGERMRAGVVDPEKEEALKIFEKTNEKYHTDGQLYLISQRSFDYALKTYKNIPKIKKFKGVEISPEDLERFKKDIKDYKELSEKINKVNTTDVVTLILATGLKTGASDIHIEAEENGITVRLRIDGVLQEAAIIDKEKWKKIISRLKIISKVKINISDSPQDGRFTIFLQNSKAEVRVSFLPTAFGESVVMRILKSDAVGLSFEDLGLSPEAYKKLDAEIKKPNGLILTTGPTGSGKTTTLYAILNKLNDAETKIITLENPIEYQLEGINQSQVNPQKNYTFANGLRSILRQDPDIVMIGEIRDLETAEISVQASLTGHLVLSTLHTNDSAGVIPRLIDMGVKPFFLIPSINGVIGQRLVRKLCPECKIKQELNEEETERIRKILGVISPKSGINIPTELPEIYKAGEGCEHCSGLGYKGRVGIYEIFTMSEKIEQLISDKAPAFKILRQAIEDGMITMLQDGVLKAIDGKTSLEEVYRVIGKFDYVDELYDLVISQTIGRGLKIKAEEMIEAEKLSKNIAEANRVIKNYKTGEVLSIVTALAVKAEAGDIHIEPGEANVKIRFRMDGMLHDIVELGKEYYPPLISQIKILSGFQTNVKKPTYDGRFSIRLPEGEKMDARVSIISGGYGETAVIRLLASQAASLNMEKLGMAPYIMEPLKKSIQKTKGMVITTGPTGSGKTTTLYSLLNHLNKPDVKIITVEDPIEYHLEGVMQTQIDKDQGYTFAAAMRSLLRQNPNIMMIGEIRDSETAKIAIEASLTGHLVLSTIHANSAAGAISRLSGLGLEKQQMSSAMNASIGQRLARRLCPDCRKEVSIEKEKLEEVKKYLSELPKNIEIPENLKFYQSEGCEACAGIGYKGRIGLYELIEINPQMQKLIQQEMITDPEIEKQAVENGTVLLIQDGILKALKGETDIDEVFRVAR